VHGVAGADSRNHANRAGRLDFVDVNNPRSLKNAQVSGLFGLRTRRRSGAGTVAQIVLLDRPISEVEQAKAETELASRSALHHAVTLQNHEKAMRRALVQLQR